MNIIDDEGNLFGLINVIDALAIMLVLAVGVAGIAVVGVLDTGETTTRYTTIDLGPQPEYIIDSVAPGDVMTVDGQNLTVTDTYATPVNTAEIPDDTEINGDTTLQVRAELEGQRVEGEFGEPRFEFGGDVLRTGDEMSLESDAYVVDGVVTTIAQTSSELPVETTPVVFETTVSPEVANEITAGDTFETGPYTLATVRAVQPYPVGGNQYRVQVGLDLETIHDGQTPQFAGQPVAIGSGLTLHLDNYSLDGRILNRGTTTPVGEATTTTAELKLENIDPDVAASLSAGMTETQRGETLATIQTVETQPAEVVLQSEDGNIYLREHPRNKDVRLTVTLQTLRTDTELRFHGGALREGTSIRLDLGEIAVRGTVTRLPSRNNG